MGIASPEAQADLFFLTEKPINSVYEQWPTGFVTFLFSAALSCKSIGKREKRETKRHHEEISSLGKTDWHLLRTGINQKPPGMAQILTEVFFLVDS